MPDRKLDWVNTNPDPRNAHFPLAAGIVDTSRPKAWAGPYVRLDQGPDGACVGFGWTIEAMSSPVRARPGGYRGKVSEANFFAFDVYRTAQTVDEWPGESYEGTSVNAGAKVMRDRAFITGWNWANGINDVIAALITEGPVVLGIPWMDTMFDTDANGLLTVGGSVAGGHCICATGWYPRLWGGPAIRLRQSWGAEWGNKGDCFIRPDDLAALLHGTAETGPGEAAVPVGRGYGFR